MRVLDGGSGWMEPIVISSDNKRIAAADRKQRGIRLFELSDGSMQKPYMKRVDDVCFYPDSNHVVLAGHTELLFVDWASGTTETLLEDAYVGNVVPIPSGELLVYSADVEDHDLITLSRWKTGRDGKLSRVSAAQLDAGAHSVHHIWPDGSKLIAVHRSPNPDNTRATILSVPDFKEVGSFAISTEWPGQLLVAPDANQIVGYRRRHMFVWDGPDWKAFRQVSIPGRRELTGLAYHPDGKRLAAACNDETVRVFDTTSWEEVSKFVWKSGRLRSVAYSADGTLAAAGSDTGKVVVWDVDE